MIMYMLRSHHTASPTLPHVLSLNKTGNSPGKLELMCRSPCVCHIMITTTQNASLVMVMLRLLRPSWSWHCRMSPLAPTSGVQATCSASTEGSDPCRGTLPNAGFTPALCLGTMSSPVSDTISMLVGHYSPDHVHLTLCLSQAGFKTELATQGNAPPPPQCDIQQGRGGRGGRHHGTAVDKGTVMSQYEKVWFMRLPHAPHFSSSMWT